MKRTAKSIVTAADSGTGLIDYLTSRFTYRSRSQWRDAVAGEMLLINGRTAAVDTTLSNGDTVEYLLPAVREPEVDRGYNILAEDEDLLFIDKPPNLPCHPAGKFFNHTLWALLRKARPELTNLHFVNRLDRETSGVVLVAKNKEGAVACRRQFSTGTVTKHYFVLVEGEFGNDTVVAEGRLGPDKASHIRKKKRYVPAMSLPDSAETSDWQEVSTCFRRLETKAGLSLVEAIPRTGRMHQIRATLCSLGFPVVGDKLYGIDDQLYLRFARGEMRQADWNRLRLPHQALHAAELGLEHPVTNAPITITAPLPPTWHELLRRLSFDYRSSPG